MFKLELFIFIRGTDTLSIATQLKLYITIVILASPKSKKGEVLETAEADEEVLDLFKSGLLDREPYFLFLSWFLRRLSNSFLRCGCLRKHLTSMWRNLL
jgi:hypothetical protein